jgi:lysophospholipase L1-like esterase
MTDCFLRRLAMAALIPVLAAAADPSAPAPRPNKPGWMERHQQKLDELRQGPVDLLFIGDSITEELDSSKPALRDINAVWQRFYGCRHAVNLGFSGDTTSNVLWRIENGETDGIRPRLAVLMIGTNNIRPRIQSSAQETEQGISAVVAELHRRLPGTQILLLGIPPSGRAAATEQERAEVNAALAARDWRNENASFLSTDRVFAPGGTLNESLYRPGPRGAVHPNAEGWQDLAQTIEPTIERLMGEKRGVPSGAVCPGA